MMPFILLRAFEPYTLVNYAMFKKDQTILLTILLVIYNVESSTTAVVSKGNDDNKNQSLSDNYFALRNDIQWFLQRLEIFASAVEGVLPNQTNNDEETSTFVGRTRIHLWRGLKYLLAGLKEISINFQQNLETQHVRQLQQLKSISEYVHDIIRILRFWFAQLRAAIERLLRIYNRYLPELLMGNCLGGYLVQTYPERQFYEYPFLLFNEIYGVFASRVNEEEAEITTVDLALDLFEGEPNMAQNEISHNEQELDARALQPLNSSIVTAMIDELNTSEETEAASWQHCLQLYTADSIARSLKMLFY